MSEITKVCTSCRQKYRDEEQNPITTCKKCEIHIMRSSLESKLFSYVKQMHPTAINNKKGILDNDKEIDIFIPEQNLAIEFNGLIWHSEIVSLQNGRDKKRDYLKYQECTRKKLSHALIYEDELLYKEEQVLNFLEYALKVHKPFSPEKITIRSYKDSPKIKELFNRYSLLGCRKRAQLAVIYRNNGNDILGAVSYFCDGAKIKIDNYFWMPEKNLSLCWKKVREHLDAKHSPKKYSFFSDNRLLQEDFGYSMGLRPVANIDPNYWYFKYPKAVRTAPADVVCKIKDTSLSEWEKLLIDGWNRIWDCGYRLWVSQ